MNANHTAIRVMKRAAAMSDKGDLFEQEGGDRQLAGGWWTHAGHILSISPTRQRSSGERKEFRGQKLCALTAHRAEWRGEFQGTLLDCAPWLIHCSVLGPHDTQYSRLSS